MHACFYVERKRKFQKSVWLARRSRANWIFEPAHPHLLQAVDLRGKYRRNSSSDRRGSLRACRGNFKVEWWVGETWGLFEVATNVRSLPSRRVGIFGQTYFEWTLAWSVSFKLDTRKKPLTRSMMRTMAIAWVKSLLGTPSQKRRAFIMRVVTALDIG
jgi:hypothetical protein